MISNFTLDTKGLLEPQVPHATKLLDSLYLNGIACDLSETGTGKTYSAAWIAKTLGIPVVIICPKSMIPTWDRVMKLFGVKPEIKTNFEKLMRGGTPWVKFRKPSKTKEDQWRYQLVQAHFPVGALIIVDESHKCKGVTSLNAGLLMALKRQGYKILTLSATQATSPTDMRAFGFAANLHNLYKWREWCLDNGAEEVGKWGAFTYDEESDQAKKKMARCHENLFDIQHIASRLTREQMGSLFPENHVVAEAYDLGSNNPKIQAVYDEMEMEIALMDEQTENYSGHVFAVIMKARRRAEMLKIPLIQEMTEDLYDEGKSVVVFLNFTESIEALGSRLQSNPKLAGKIGFVYGEPSMKQRLRDVDAFNADKKRVLICNLKAGGASLSYHDLIGNHARASIISPSFSAIDMHQAMGRIHRQGGLTKCYQRILYAAGCIEEHACRRVQMRLDNLSCLTDGDLTSGFNIFNN